MVRVVREFLDLVNVFATTAEFTDGELHLHLGYDFGTRCKQSLIPFRPIIQEGRTVIESYRLANRLSSHWDGSSSTFSKPAKNGKPR